MAEAGYAGHSRRVKLNLNSSRTSPVGTANGNLQAVEEGKQAIKSALIGYALAGLAPMLVSILQKVLHTLWTPSSCRTCVAGASAQSSCGERRY